MGTKNYSNTTKERNHKRKVVRYEKWLVTGLKTKRVRLIRRLKQNDAIQGDEASLTIKQLRKRLWTYTKHNPERKWTIADQIKQLEETRVWKSSNKV